MALSLVQELIAACGYPVAGHSLSVEEMDKAVKEGRALSIYYWSNFGQGETSFSFATHFGLTTEGMVRPNYIVFPRPIPPELRRDSDFDWEKTAHVFAAFDIDA